MYIKFFIVILLTALVAGCVTSKVPSADAWGEYQSFEKELTKESGAVELSPYLSGRLMSFVYQAANDDERRQVMAEVAYPMWVANETAHYQKSADNGGICLTVNGLASDGEPASVSIRYVVEGRGLKADEVHYELVGDESQLRKHAQCPSDFSLEYPLVES